MSASYESSGTMKARFLAGTVAAGLLLAFAPTSAQAAEKDVPAFPPVCDSPLSNLPTIGSTTDDVNAGKITIYNQSANIDLTKIDLEHSPFKDASRTMYYRSLVWLLAAFYPGPLASNVAGSTDPVGSVLDILARTPDPGSSTPALLAKANTIGWDEGTSLRRAATINCLYALTGDSRLIPDILVHVSEMKDMNRYYGPPKHVVHNHGTMANLVLLDSATLLHDDATYSFAVDRLLVEAPKLFTPSGFTLEQSSGYHYVNLRMWLHIKDILSNKLGATEPRVVALNAILQKASNVDAYLTSPLGYGAGIGDGDAGFKGIPGKHRFLGFVDPVSGIAAMRWSWTNPNTSWWTLRYGSARRYHGHDDWGSITWNTLGVPVLVDPGYYSYDASKPWVLWQKSSPAHNVPVPNTPVTVAKKPVRSMKLVRTGSIDTILLNTVILGAQVSRTLVINNKAHNLTITDKVAGKFTSPLHLDAGWVYSSKTARTLSFVNGKKHLTLSLPKGAAATIIKGSLARKMFGGWVFRSFEVATPAPEILIAGSNSLTYVLTIL